jgi:hypothetical protein
MLADPDRVEAQLLGVADFVEEVLIVLLFGAVLGVVIEEREQPEFHRRFSGVALGSITMRDGSRIAPIRTKENREQGLLRRLQA